MQDSHKKPVFIVENPKKDGKVITKLKIEEEDKESNLQASHESISINEEEIPDPFLNFVNSYSLFINDSESTCLDMETVLTQLNEQVSSLNPPQNKLDEFHQRLAINSNEIQEMVLQLKQLPDSKLCQCIQNIEKLNYKLMENLEEELAIGKQLGLL